MRSLRRRQLAQSATEYMLVISVIVIALTAAVYNPMNAALSQGSQGYKQRYQEAGRQGYMGQGSDGKR